VPSGESAEERRARKAREKEANHARFAEEIAGLLKPVNPSASFEECVAEHQRLRGKIVEMQQLVITGRFDPRVASDYERQLVEQIHRVEDVAHKAAAPAGVLPTAADRRPPPGSSIS
jgi:hypothetical protein